MRKYCIPAIDMHYSWMSCGQTHPGKVRKVNEDDFLHSPSQAHWVVADGMGGHSKGDYASRAIKEALGKLDQTAEFADFVDDIDDCLSGVNSHLLQLAEQNNETVGSTVVGLTVRQGIAFYYWAGDSRLYRYRQGQLELLSVDHTVVQELISAGQLTQEEAKYHPEKNVITRAVGSEVDLILDFAHTDIQDSDIFFLCSDGVEKELEDEDLAAHFATTSDIQHLQKQILESVLHGQARDNITLILIQFTAIESGA